MQHPGTKTITWKLNDLALTRKWIDTYKNKFNSLIATRKTKNPFVYTTVIDLYTQPTEQLVLQSYRAMNSMIDVVNQSPYIKNKINQRLKLNEDNLDQVEINKLNRLHEEFETIMSDITEHRAALGISSAEWKQLWLALQSINLIVHYNEKFTSGENIKNYIDKSEPFYFTALKWEEPPGSTVYLQPEDYADFTLEETPGTLWLDFGTVGKDLFHCFCTNDVELVQSNMVSAQWELKPWVSYHWTGRTSSDAKKFEDEFNEWLTQINASDFLDCDDPKYTSGRHPLGECISHSFTDPQQFIDAIISTTPKIRCYFLTDDDGNNII